MKNILIKIFTVSLVACASNPLKPIGCDVEQLAANAAAKGVMSVCSCTDENAVSTYLIGKLGSYNLCPASGKRETKEKGVIGSMVCAPLINALATAGCSQIPSCTGGNPSSSALNSAIVLCESKI